MQLLCNWARGLTTTVSQTYHCCPTLPSPASSVPLNNRLFLQLYRSLPAPQVYSNRLSSFYLPGYLLLALLIKSSSQALETAKTVYLRQEMQRRARNSRTLVEMSSNHHEETTTLWKRRCRLGHPLPQSRGISSVCQSNFALRRAPQQQQQLQNLTCTTVPNNCLSLKQVTQYQTCTILSRCTTLKHVPLYWTCTTAFSIEMYHSIKNLPHSGIARRVYFR